MSNSESTKKSVGIAQGLLNAIWPYINNRRGLIILAIAAAASGMALNWGWLVAAGIAPILLTALPCLAMCGLGLCMSGSKGKSCSSDDEAPVKQRDLKIDQDGDE